MLNNIGLPGLLLIAVVVLVLFGRGKISSLMGDVAQGIKSFKKGMADDDTDKAASAKTIDHEPAETVSKTTNANETKAG